MFRICTICAHRCELPAMFEELGFRIGVEVGVLHGKYSRVLLSNWSGKLHLVDPWMHYPGYNELSLRPEEFQNHEYNLTLTMQSLEGFPKRRYQIWRELDSENLADRIGEADFAYIDGNHAFKYVTEDLHIWWKRIRPGGILAGHDLFQMTHPDVTEALVLFAREHGVDVMMVHGKQSCECGEGGFPSWYIKKG